MHRFWVFFRTSDGLFALGTERLAIRDLDDPKFFPGVDTIVASNKETTCRLANPTPHQSDIITT